MLITSGNNEKLVRRERGSTYMCQRESLIPDAFEFQVTTEYKFIEFYTLARNVDG